jgi:hypothetical protein
MVLGAAFWDLPTPWVWKERELGPERHWVAPSHNPKTKGSRGGFSEASRLRPRPGACPDMSPGARELKGEARAGPEHGSRELPAPV